MSWIIPPPVQPSLPVRGTEARFPVRRIFCVGRNYAEHAAEMGVDVDRQAPFYFTKSAYALAAPGDWPYPPATQDLHHEVELVLALGGPVDAGDPLASVLGWAVGLDMTRRDLQTEAKDKRRPWDTAKDFDGAAVIGPLCRAFAPGAQDIRLAVNGAPRQHGKLSDMVWAPAPLLAHLAGLYALQAGDLVMTGTPAGVGALTRGDRIEAEITGLPLLHLTVV